ncbi:efflux RND transporter periplasmic adaptor subunit [Gilvimarinus agarilyticus]|uniref:efflux RND transporter periplasmic adaptor subunit n=1 Tax=Gilvimarinus agarilyticus TaxID=679259 RepID=UPI0005A08EC5|nr:efflux RND transporter periplasmic adaptor subunit [Gilvimarinus agarilyticus]
MQSLIPYQLWLRLQCQALPPIASAVLVRLGGDNNVTPVASWPASGGWHDTLGQIARQALSEQRISLLEHGEHQLLLAQPLVQQQALVVTLKQSDRETVSAVSRRLKADARWFELVTNQVQPLGPEALYSLFTAVLHEASVVESCLTLVNQLSHWLGCERVAVGLVDSRSVLLQAVSNSADIDPRTRANDTLKRAMQEIVQQRQEIGVKATKEDQHHPQHWELLTQTGALAIDSLPLMFGRELVAIVTLQWHQSPDVERLAALRAQLANIASVMHFKRLAEQRSLRKSIRHQWQGKKRASWIVATAGFSLLLLVGFLPVDYRIAADAQLQGAEKNMVVAKQEGFLAEVMARPGDRVEQGEPLARLDERELRLERRKLAAQLQQLRQEYNNALANSERAKAAIAAAQIDQADIKLQLLEQQLKRTQVLAPIAGVVVSDDITQSTGKPLRMGEVLFEISSTDQFRVILYVDERDIVQVQPQQTGTLVLSSLPSERFTFLVERITPVSAVRDGLNRFRVEASLQGPSSLVQPGMTGTAKVLVGRQPLGWIALHRLIDWFRLRLWW